MTADAWRALAADRRAANIAMLRNVAERDERSCEALASEGKPAPKSRSQAAELRAMADALDSLEDVPVRGADGRIIGYVVAETRTVCACGHFADRHGDTGCRGHDCPCRFRFPPGTR